jgi:predicted nuclease with TOPRIM domain
MMPRKTKIIETEVQEDASETIKIAVLGNELKHINDSVNRLENKFDEAIKGFVTHEKLADAQKAADNEHKNILEKISALEDWNKWAIRIVLGLVITAVVSFVLVTKIQ